MATLNLFIYKEDVTILHKMHPTLKIILMGFISFLLTYGNNIILVYYTTLVLIGFILSKLNIYLILKDLKYIIFLGSILTIFSGDIIPSVIYTLKIGIIILLGTLFMGTTRPEDITPGLYNIIRNKKLTENISLTIRLIPTFLISWGEIEESLKSRGLYLSKNPLKIIFNITIPLLIETFKRGDSISMAMESRCYSGWVKSKVFERGISISIIALTISPTLLLIKMP